MAQLPTVPAWAASAVASFGALCALNVFWLHKMVRIAAGKLRKASPAVRYGATAQDAVGIAAAAVAAVGAQNSVVAAKSAGPGAAAGDFWPSCTSSMIPCEIDLQSVD